MRICNRQKVDPLVTARMLNWLIPEDYVTTSYLGVSGGAVGDSGCITEARVNPPSGLLTPLRGNNLQMLGGLIFLNEPSAD